MRLSVRSSFVPAAGATDSGPVVLVLSGELVPREQTPQTDAQLRSLLPTPAHLPPVPAAALNVAAQLLANEAGIDDHPAATRLAYAPGQWVTVRAARLSPPASGSEPDIVVTISRASTSERVEVYARALGLTSRETELVAFLVTGADTRGVAHSMGITEHTVNDHLKAIFSKAGTQSRRQLIANAAG
jgi:DNA-binding NarL/FixJ family response regulator